MQKPLQGIKVLDLGQGVAAPYCGLLMAQYGAEVIKVEPLNGDWMRGLGKNWKGQTAYSVTYNLGKKGIAVDLKKQEGINLILKIAETCDVVLENFRPGVVDRLGIGFSDIKALNDKVLYVSVSGFGQTGPYNQRPGSDGVLQAFSGSYSQQSLADQKVHLRELIGNYEKNQADTNYYEQRIKSLSPESLDVDLLEEEMRDKMFFTKKNEIILVE